MKINLTKRAMSVALFVAFAGAYALPANAQQPDLRKFLVGQWCLQLGVQGCPHHTVFQPDGMFKMTIVVNGNISDPTWTSGTWEIRNGNQLWVRNMAWYPILDGGIPNVRGRRIPIREWDWWTIQVVDSNHIKVDALTSVRITR